jgi:hypothetical protein
MITPSADSEEVVFPRLFAAGISASVGCSNINLHENGNVDYRIHEA